MLTSDATNSLKNLPAHVLQQKSVVKTFHLILVLLIKCNDTLCSKEFESVLLSLWSTKKYQLTFYMIHLVSIFKDLHQFAKLNALKDPKGT